MLLCGCEFCRGLKRRKTNCCRTRGQRGNMLILIVSILMGILMLLLGFSLSYVRMLGSNAEQKTAIEAAALAAARDLARIVIEDPNFGFISLSDAAPATPNTKAEDGFSMPVVGINTLLATIRLDMIIASELGDSTMSTLAQSDYTNAMAAKDFLVANLQQAMLPGSGGSNLRDVDGNVVSPYQAAVEAYQQNVVRIAGGNSRMVNGSMKLTLGALTSPSATCTQIPPDSPNTSGTQAMQGYYTSYNDIPYGGKSFVFAGIGKDVKLVDVKNFVTSLGSVPYFIPTIVKAEADHMVVSAGQGGANIIHSVACAQPASVHDPRPAPGAITLGSFPGKIPDLPTPESMMTNPQLSTVSLDIKTSINGDSPGGGTITPAPASGFGSSMPVSQAFSMGMYDWIRRAGTKPSLKAIKAFMKTPFAPGITDTVGGVNCYTWNADGTIRYVQMPGLSSRNVVVSHFQGRVDSSNVFNSSNGNSYKVIGTDESRQPGRMRGGRHGGEPLEDPVVQACAGLPGTTIAGADTSSDIAGLVALLLMVAVPSGLFVAGTQRNNKVMRQVAAALLLAGTSASALGLLTACGGGSPPPPVVVTTTVTGPRVNRPTYTSNGIVVDITFVKQ
jgi:hypothetical protein